MDHLKQAAFSITVVIAAGFWGYGGDTLVARIDEAVEDFNTEEVEQEAGDKEQTVTQNAPVDNSPQNAQRPASARPSPYSATVPSARTRPTRPDARPPMGGNNPYAAMGKPQSLKGTLDSINSGGIRNQQRQKRNLYFERLSQQLKDLQGDDPPPPPEERLEEPRDREQENLDESGIPPPPTAAIATEDEELLEVDADGVILDEYVGEEELSDEELDAILDEIIE